MSKCEEKNISVSNVESFNINVSVRLSFFLLDFVPQLQLAAAARE